LFDWCSYTRGRDGVEFGGEPGLEPREVFVARCQQTVASSRVVYESDLISGTGVS
jgi:hypothetical protein